MALPIIFGPLTPPQNLTDFDVMFNAVAALGAIPCLASGTNAIALVPFVNTPTIASYTDLAPSFIFSCPATNTSSVTLNISSVGAKSAFKVNGTLPMVAGDMIFGAIYKATFSASLNGFIVDAMSGPFFTNSTLEFIIDGGGVAITTGVKGYLKIGYSANVSAWEVMADQSGSIVIDILRANSAVPTVSMIGGGNKPTLSSQQFNVQTPSGWTSAVLQENDWLGFNVVSATTVTRVTLALDLAKL